ncbi:hypothetical protein B0H12DRAFT_1122738 [Mycena haematopus]|nr:hypothetical protein B0H12DRAFT_1122738 [Mycena haematopus]
MQRSFIVLLFLALVHAALQNYTVDDTSPDITYGEEPFQCNPTTCPGGIVEEGLFNNTITLTNGTITFSFTGASEPAAFRQCPVLIYSGTAFYTSIYLLGTASITIDGRGEVTYNITLEDLALGLDGQPNFSSPGLSNGPHTLVIAPTTSGTLVGFDHLIYTAVLPTKKHVGAIVGGVIGGVALILGALFAALYARRRKLIIRRNQRKSAVLRGMTAARTADHKVSPENGTNLPM